LKATGMRQKCAIRVKGASIYFITRTVVAFGMSCALGRALHANS